MKKLLKVLLNSFLIVFFLFLLLLPMSFVPAFYPLTRKEVLSSQDKRVKPNLIEEVKQSSETLDSKLQEAKDR